VRTEAPRPVARVAEARSSGRRPGDPWLRWAPAVLAAVCYVPLLFTHRGEVGADTKQYLYLDPSRLLARAPSMWDPNVGMGTVTHQNIGYLLPMGPWYWIFRTVGVPVWVAQRLWTGTLLFLAGLGVVYLLRCLAGDDRTAQGDRAAFAGRAVVIAALAYALSPYVLEYEARISAILMPWAALPWMLALIVRGLRRPGWRYPALFALVVALCGSVNATSLIYAGVAPLLWVPYAVWVVREVPLRRAAVTVAQTGLLTVLGSLWWMSGLWTQAHYGLDVLRYTETVKTVAQTGLPIEVLRGLGNWYFYGRDSVGPWVQPASEYTQQLWRLAISYAVPLAAFASAVTVRWRHKLYFLGLLAVGLALAVGVYPYSNPSPVGGVFKAIANSSSAGLALRSVGRAAPLVVLGTAVLIGAGLDALGRWRPRQGALASGLVALIVVVNMAPLLTGQFVDDNLQRPEAVPGYWKQAIAALDKGSHSTRVLELPGADFSHYRWGTTLDPITPGLMDRPFVSRELIPYGSPPSADLIRALDEGLQEGVFEPSALAPIARLISAGDVVLRSDLQYERFRTPRPRSTWEALSSPPPAGLSSPTAYGPTVPETPVIPLTDEISLATPPSAPDPPAVAVYDVPGTPGIVHTEPAAEPLLVAGDGQGLVDSAAAGILDDRGGPILYSADLAADPAAMRSALSAGAALLLTDTNRKRGQRWGTIRDNNGATEAAGEQPIANDPTDARLPVFPGASDSSSTVAERRGVATVRATAYGNPVSYDPAHRPSGALDADPLTSWTEGAFSDVNGQRLRIDLSAPVTADHLSLVQPLIKPDERWITKATVLFDGASDGVPVDLGPSSRTASGQRVTFPSRTFHRVDIRVDAMNFGRRADYSGGSGVGFSSVVIPGVPVVQEVLRLPTDLLAAAGPSSIDHRLEVELSRWRAQPLESFITDPELSIARTFDLPTGRTFALRGTARISAQATDDASDAALGRPGLAAAAATARSGSSLPGDLRARAASAIDGDPGTAWQAEFGSQGGNWLEVTSPHPVTADHLGLTVVADGRHSVPTRLRVQVDGGATQDVNVPPVTDTAAENATSTVNVALQPVTGSRFRITVVGVRDVTTLNYFSQVHQPLPMGIAELAIPGVATPPAAPAALPPTCRTDLLAIDGKPVPMQVTGTTGDALRGSGLDVAPCPGTPPITLAPGRHDVVAAPGRDTGIDLDRLLLASEKGGAALPLGSLASSTPVGTAQGAGPTGTQPLANPIARVSSSPAPSSPPVTVLQDGRTSMRLRVDGSATAPYWLVLGQSHNAGWTAHVSGPGLTHAVSLGSPKLVDGYANGWLIQPTGTAGPLVVTLTWTPQRVVDVALIVSAVSLLACLVVALWPVRRRWAPVGAEHLMLPARPEMWQPWRPDGHPLRMPVAIGIWAVTTALAVLVIKPFPGAVVGVLVGIVLLRPRWRALLSVGSVAVLAACILYVLQLQLRYHFPPKIEWPGHFDRIALVPWVAVALLVADSVIEYARSTRPGRRRPPDDGRAEPPGA